jgi:hypothetical protein
VGDYGMQEENKAIAILFERKLFGKQDGAYVYTYVPMEVLYGVEQTFDDTKIFSCPSRRVLSLDGESCDCYNEDDDKFEFNYIEDLASLSEKYVYGFPLITNNQPAKTTKKTFEYVQNSFDQLNGKIINQFYDEEYLNYLLKFKM